MDQSVPTGSKQEQFRELMKKLGLFEGSSVKLPLRELTVALSASLALMECTRIHGKPVLDEDILEDISTSAKKLGVALFGHVPMSADD